MALVDYSDSESDGQQTHATPPAKKRKISSDEKDSLPPLPSSFLDQYSSTVRTSTLDDPSLHGGRTRVTPHIEGNWPTHVYLEWHPGPAEHDLLSKLIATASDDGEKGQVHSLLDNDLGVSLPLHVSLSRPLVVKTAQREPFLSRLKRDVHEHGAKIFTARPKDLLWHRNESSTRWFLVFRLETTPELSTLLAVCNGVASEFGQPLLYADGKDVNEKMKGDEMHVSIAWSLRPPVDSDVQPQEHEGLVKKHESVLHELPDRLRTLEIRFGEVKVRIGQDVHVIPLKPRRASTT